MMREQPSNDAVSEARAGEAVLAAEIPPGDRPALLGGAPAFTARLPFMRPTLPAWDSLVQPIREIITSGMLTKGRYLEAFEERVARHLEVKHAVAVSSCTAGLMLVYQSLALGGEVLVPSFTFMATVHPLVWQGATPVFIDVDPDTWNVDPRQVEAHITPKTTAIVAVHLYGNPAPIEALEAVARAHGLALIFDAAHGFGALHQGEPVGRHGVAEVFSTSPTKLLVTGEGGVVATNDDDLAGRVRIAREYGNPGNYDSLLPGINARMQEFSAILGLRCLELLAGNAERRNALASRYKSHLAGLPGLTFQTIRLYDRSSFKDFTIRIEAAQFGLDRDTLSRALALEGIDTRAYYAPPVHRHAAYRELVRSQRPHLPLTESLAREVLSLPMYAHMSEEDVAGVCRAIRRIHRCAPQIRAAVEPGQTSRQT